MTRITRIKLIMRSTKNVDKPNESRVITTSRNSSSISNKKIKRTYVAAAVAAAAPVSPMLSRKRLAMSGKKSSLGKNSKPAVARVRSPKT